jgi:vancomycin permeability regulator SanA
LKSKVLLHIAVFIDVVAALKIAASRAIVENLPNGIASPQNIPLAAIVIVVILLAEFSFQNKISRFHILVFLSTSIVFLLSSFYIPPVGESAEEPSVFAYAALMIQLSGSIVIAFSKKPDLGKIFAAIVLVVGIFTAAGFVYTFSNGDTFPASLNSDAVVVLGASVWGKHKPSPVLRGRLDAAIKIFDAGRVKKIVATGGTKRFDTIESEVQAWYLRQNGIPDSAIITEHNTFCTCEQAEYIKKILIDSLGMKNIVVVTDSWHLPRALLMCRWENAKVYGSQSNYRMDFAKGIYSRLRESAATQVFILFGA